MLFGISCVRLVVLVKVIGMFVGKLSLVSVLCVLRIFWIMWLGLVNVVVIGCLF